ncbi:MAG: hypothetical protein AAGA77_02980 [Bacteroidota bacterium]
MLAKRIFMLYSITIMILINVSAQHIEHLNEDNFEHQVLKFEPVQCSTVSDDDFEYATMVLREVKNAVQNDVKNFCRGDYYNLVNVFKSLNAPIEHVALAFDKFIKSEGSCMYVIQLEKKIRKKFKTTEYAHLLKQYNEKLEQCRDEKSKKAPLNIVDYSNKNGFDLELVTMMNHINEQDKYYRLDKCEGWRAKQRELDRSNQVLIDSIFAIHKTYIGNSMVGEKFSGVMWAVIQHSSLEMMEKYLPIVKEAAHNGNLSVESLKMLIDRFYGLKYGYQFFNTQLGFGFKKADANQITEIKRKFGLL